MGNALSIDGAIHPDYGECGIIKLVDGYALICYPILHMASGEERLFQRWVAADSLTWAVKKQSDQKPQVACPCDGDGAGGAPLAIGVEDGIALVPQGIEDGPGAVQQQAGLLADLPHGEGCSGRSGEGAQDGGLVAGVGALVGQAGGLDR